MAHIFPTVGRIVHFRPDPVGNPDIVYAALVSGVVSDDVVNLSVHDFNGDHFARQGVPLVQDGQKAPDAPHAHWMPYQVAQAAQVDEASAKAAVTPVLPAVDASGAALLAAPKSKKAAA